MNFLTFKILKIPDMVTKHTAEPSCLDLPVKQPHQYFGYVVASPQTSRLSNVVGLQGRVDRLYNIRGSHWLLRKWMVATKFRVFLKRDSENRKSFVQPDFCTAKKRGHFWFFSACSLCLGVEKWTQVW